MLLSMKKELKLRQNFLNDKILKTLYFGGGTPSILTVDEIHSLIDEVLRYFDFDENIEITIEANPDDLDKNYLKQLSHAPINRLSIGIQSFFDTDLKLMNRAHNASEAEYAVKCAQDFGFENISIDLIYGSPASDMTQWKKNLQKTLELGIPHISSYAFTVEPKTAVHQWIKTKKILPPEENVQNEQFYYMSELLRANGFLHYEISNFALEGYHSKHNSGYWAYLPYLGIGPSAHSYDGTLRRMWNVANNSLYIKHLSEDKLPSEQELLSEKDRYNEMIMIGLRTMWGVSLSRLKADFSREIWDYFDQEIQQKLASGILVVDNGFLKIPEAHWFMADGIASDLFLV